LAFFSNNNDVTIECIKSFAEGTKYFTNGGFSKLLLEENNEFDAKKDEIDILSKEYDNDLKNENFKKKLIFIIKNKMLYYNLDISEQALKNGEALYKLDENQKNERENNKQIMTPEYLEKIEYLEILKKILDLKNPVNNKKKKKNDLKSLIEIIDEENYVITRDNFRKMILILYRIIANIPVILMGETGCGKTKLIKVLNQLLNNGQQKLKVLNIDPSYKDNDLIREMNEINENSKEYGNDEFWVFFDELNTCDSLALITEIFINRSYNNKPLRDNIRLIGACNPYRKKKKGLNICGLTYPNDDDTNDLVYLVNILPQTLMYYVFNFGSLENENEKLYISSIISNTIKEEKLREATKDIISESHQFLR
jgi:energy-coupling factor transporter ATP-binding protein EcfA2